jgi:hypothetical protein
VKTLTVRQPWAWAIARGHKLIENRPRATSHRGPLAIHSGKQWDDSGVEALRSVVHTIRAQGGTHPPVLAGDPLAGAGLVLAVVDLVDVCTAALRGEACDCGPWAMPRAAHWQFANARPLAEPFPARGALYLWDCDAPALTAGAV